MDHLYKNLQVGDPNVLYQAKMILNEAIASPKNKLPTISLESSASISPNINNSAVHKHDLSNFLKEVGTYILVDSQVFIDLIYKAYLDKPCEICFKHRVFIDNFTNSSGSPTVQLSCHTRGCIWAKRIRCSMPDTDSSGHRMRFSELPARMVYSFLLSGLCYRNYEEVLQLLDVDYLSSSQFQSYQEKMHTVVEDLLLPKLKENRQKLKTHLSSVIMIDGRWSSRGWNANECTVSVFNAVTKELLHVEHVLRKLGHNDKHGNYIGASSSMEGFAVAKICQLFIAEQLPVDMVVHDHDGETLKIIQKYYPEAGEYFDVAHKGKNLKKKIIKLKKDYPALAGFGDRVLRSFMWCLQNCAGDNLHFARLMTNQYNHFCDIDHKYCTHEVNYAPKWHFITDIETREALWNEYNAIIINADKYIKRFGTNAAESFNNIISKYCNKRLNFHSSYRLRANMAALQYVTPDYKYQVFKKLGLKISNKLTTKLFNEIVKKEKQTLTRQNPQYIEKTKINRYKKRKRNANKEGQHKYKGRTMKPLTIKQLKEKIQLMGVKVPSRLKKREDLENFYKDLQILPDSWVAIEPLDIDTFDEEENLQENEEGSKDK